MAKDMERRHGVSVERIPVDDVDQDWTPAPIVVQRTNLPEWEWAMAAKPPAVNAFQEKFAKAVTPFRFVALAFLFLTWHWARSAAFLLVVALILVLIFTR